MKRICTLFDIVPALRRVQHFSLTDRPCLAVIWTLCLLVVQLDRLELLFVVQTLTDDWSSPLKRHPDNRSNIDMNKG